MTQHAVNQAPVTEPQWNLELFGAWHLWRAGADYEMRSREQRLVAVLALQGRRRRSYLAGILWPDSTEARAGASLRAAICRTDQNAPGLLLHDHHEVGLDPALRVDVRDFSEYVWRLCTTHKPAPAPDEDPREFLRLLRHGDLLPGWYDDWVIYERARLQQLQVQALEVAADRMLTRGQLTAAFIAASAAVTIEPLRESAQRTLIRIHLHNGNYHAALRDYREFRLRLRRELGIAPSSQMLALVRALRRDAAPPAAGIPANHRIVRNPSVARVTGAQPTSRSAGNTSMPAVGDRQLRP
jgi:DNA-binding SARP family transcriptional activator